MKNFLKLNNGNKMPILGLGTWKADKNLVGEAVRYAIIRAGYTHIDCAAIYRNEPEIGLVFNEVFKKVKREKVFITSKLWNTEHHPKDVEKAYKKTLKDLNLGYLDLYLMHWGIAFKSGEDSQLAPIPIQETWQAMENLVKKGLVKSIGVCNFTTMMLVDLLSYAKIKPVINQIELHPYNTQEQLITFCKNENIAVTAYSPLANPGLAGRVGPNLLKESLIKKIAKKYRKTPAQILLNWAISRGTITISKSLHPERIKENINIFDFELAKEEQDQISSLNRNFRVVNPGSWWGIPYFE